MPNQPVPYTRVGISIMPREEHCKVCEWKGGLSASGSRNRRRVAERLEALLREGYTIVGGELDRHPKDGQPLLIGLILEKRAPRATHRRRRKS